MNSVFGVQETWWELTRVAKAQLCGRRDCAKTRKTQSSVLYQQQFVDQSR